MHVGIHSSVAGWSAGGIGCVIWAKRNGCPARAGPPASGSPRDAHALNLPGPRFRPLAHDLNIVRYVRRPPHIEFWRVLHGQWDIPQKRREFYSFLTQLSAKILNTGKSAFEIVLQIDDGLEAYSNPQQGFGDSRCGTLLGRNAAVRR
jgi:hypothetical protein